MKKRLLYILLAVALVMTSCGKSNESKDIIVAESSVVESEVSDTVEDAENPKVTAEPEKATEAPEETAAPEVTEEPATEKPEITEAPKVTQAPEATKAPATEKPKGTDKPVVTEAPRATATPRPTDAPTRESAVTEAPRPTEVPATEAPVVTEAPKPTDAPTPAPTQAPAHEHSWDRGTVTTNASCSSEGVKTYACACGETKTESIPATGNHNWVTDWVLNYPTCSCHGTESQKCTECGANKTYNTPKTDDHTYEVTEAGCGEVPTMYECKDCHEWYEKQEASCKDSDGDQICDLYGCWLGE